MGAKLPGLHQNEQDWLDSVPNVIPACRAALDLLEPVHLAVWLSWWALAMSMSKCMVGVALADIDLDAALDELNSALIIARHASVDWVVGMSMRTLAQVHLRQRNPEAALDLIMQSVRAVRRRGQWSWVANYLLGAAVAFLDMHEYETAATLFGASGQNKVNQNPRS